MVKRLGYEEPHLSIEENGDAVTNRVLFGEVYGRVQTRGNAELRNKYKEYGIINSSPAVTRFIEEHKAIISDRRLYNKDGSNFLEGILPTTVIKNPEERKAKIRTILSVMYGIADEEITEMMPFFDDLFELKDDPDLKKIMQDTKAYKETIKSKWNDHERGIMSHIERVLGYRPARLGKVKVYIVNPTINTQRSYPESDDSTNFIFGKPRGEDINKILANLAHQAIHQPMFPYKSSMTGKQRIEFHAFIKFLADKDVYNYLTGRSYLDIVTENENAEAMGKVYPYFLGYRYRNVTRDGLDPAEEIRKAIERDKAYFDSLPLGSKKRRLFEKYEFEKLDPRKIAAFFREKRAIKPYDFAKINFDDKTHVYKSKYLVREEEAEKEVV